MLVIELLLAVAIIAIVYTTSKLSYRKGFKDGLKFKIKEESKHE